MSLPRWAHVYSNPNANVGIDYSDSDASTDYSFGPRYPSNGSDGEISSFYLFCLIKNNFFEILKSKLVQEKIDAVAAHLVGDL